jgi:hypothetical protein
MAVRTADPYRDLDVIDARAPRANQTVIGVGALIAVVTGFWPLLALLALQLALGLRFGRRWCLACVAYFELIQPRFGEGPLEDSRPPRAANVIGLVVLTAASMAYLAGFALLGAVLGSLVAALALLAATTGFCTGCEMYRLAARLRGIGHRDLRSIDPGDLSEPLIADAVVEFTHPLCSDCHTLERTFREQGKTVITVDVKARPDLARKYGIGVVPTAVSVDSGGAVLARLT